jgi:peptidoglycan hydrolase-like protein with peptidoglycan-binding domain
MATRKVCLLAQAVTGGLVFIGATAAAIAGHAPTHAAVAASKTASPPVNLDNCAMLAAGFHGGCVSQLQTELKAWGVYNLPVDGVFGHETSKAVITFQQEHEIVPADGVVGPQTREALDGPGAAANPGF